MKFETILDCYRKACMINGEIWMTDEHFLTRFQRRKMTVIDRQRAAFRARLVEMYKLKGATRQERTVARACDELGIDYVADWNSPTDPEYEKAYYHGVDVGLEVADPELFGEDHALSRG